MQRNGGIEILDVFQNWWRFQNKESGDMHSEAWKERKAGGRRKRPEYGVYLWSPFFCRCQNANHNLQAYEEARWWPLWSGLHLSWTLSCFETLMRARCAWQSTWKRLLTYGFKGSVHILVNVLWNMMVKDGMCSSSTPAHHSLPCPHQHLKKSQKNQALLACNSGRQLSGFSPGLLDFFFWSFMPIS